jgi:hypothetical protein
VLGGLADRLPGSRAYAGKAVEALTRLTLGRALRRAGGEAAVGGLRAVVEDWAEGRAVAMARALPPRRRQAGAGPQPPTSRPDG